MRTIPDTLDDIEERLRKKVKCLVIGISQLSIFYINIVKEEFAEKPQVQQALLLPLPFIREVIKTLNKAPDVFARVKRKVTLSEDMQVTLQFMFEG